MLSSINSISKYILSFFVLFLGGFYVVSAQTNKFTLDFESGAGVGYSTSVAECTNGSNDYFTWSDGSNQTSTFTNIQGSAYFAAQDIDGCAASSTQTLTISGIDISGCTSLEFRVHIAEDDDGANQDWDDNTYMHISGSIDGGASEEFIWVEGTGGTNVEPAIDTDFDGVGDGTAITDAFTQFTNSISGTGSSLDITITFGVLDAGDEDIAIDNIEIWGNCGTCSDPAPTFQDSLITFSNVGSSSMDISWTQSSDASGSIVIINTTNSFTDPVDGTDPVANPAYGGSGEQVVYNGTGNSVTVTGLSPTTTYWARVYSYNCTGDSIKFNTNTAEDNPNDTITSTAPTCPFTDDFSGGLGQWSNNANWTTTAGEMQHNGSGGGTEYNYADMGSQDLTSSDYEWNFCMRFVSADPSGSNNFEFFLISDATNLTGTPNGYSVGINRTATSDIITLYRIDNGVYSDIIVTTFDWNADDDVCFRVTRTSTGDWTLYYDPNSTGEVNGGSVNDVTHTSGSYIGPLFEYTSTRAGFLYVDDVSVCGGAPCTDPAPTYQDSLITFSNITDTSISLSWTKSSDAAGSIVIINTTNSFTDPTDGTDPSANSVYGGSGEQVVYKGTGTSVTVTGLSANTGYWFRVYSFNCSGDSIKFNTNTAEDNPNTDTTIAAFGVATLLDFRVIPTVCLEPDSIFKIKVCAEDDGGNLDTSYSESVTISINTQPGGGTLSGTLTNTASNGCVVYDDLSLDVLGSYTLAATDGTLNGTSDTISIEASCVGQSIWQGLIINEASNGSVGNEEYYEFLVAGECGQAVDIRNWILDDNNGSFTGTFDKSSGVAPGHIRLKDTPHWQLIPVGSIIVVYNPDDINSEVPADDPFDSNNDSLYVAAITNDILFEQCLTIPYYNNKNDWDSTYAGCTPYTDVGSWNPLSIRNDGDAIQVRTPTGDYYHGISYGYQELASELLTGGQDSLYMSTSSGSNTVYYFNDNDYRDVADWSVESPVSSANQTPGTYNNAANEAWVKSLRDAGAASCPISQLTPLPANIIKAKADIVSSKINVIWEDITNHKTETYEVLRSIDGNTFKSIGSVKNPDLQSGEFEFLDKNPVPGENYYKIKGKLNYSNTVKVNLDRSFRLNGIYPNPGKDLLFVDIFSEKLQKIDIHIYSVLSQKVNFQTSNFFVGNNRIKIDLKNFASGTYIVKINTGEELIREKIEVIK